MKHYCCPKHGEVTDQMMTIKIWRHPDHPGDEPEPMVHYYCCPYCLAEFLDANIGQLEECEEGEETEA